MEIILGKSQTGKSKYIFECIEKNREEGAEVILFVPSQMRAMTEKKYMEETARPGMIGVNVTTIGTYVTEQMKEYSFHLREQYVSKLDKKIILTQVVTENPQIWNVFKKVQHKEGFLDLLAIYMDLFRKGEIDRKKLEKISFKNPLLEYKVKEIAQIYEKFEEKLTQRFLDTKDEMEMFISKIERQPEKYQNTKIYFDGYNNFTPSEYQWIKMLLQLGVEIHVTLTTDITGIQEIALEQSSEIFEVSNQTYQMLLKLANDTKTAVENKILYNNHSQAVPDLAYLADQLFSVDPVTPKDMPHLQVTIENNVYFEVQHIAQKIAQKIEEGYRYQDFCIYTTDIASYESIFQRIFYEYHIPIYQDTGVSLESSRLTQYLEKLLALCVQGITTDTVLELLKLGLNQVTRYEILILENYMIEFNISKYSLHRPFRYNNHAYGEVIYDLESLNETREKIVHLVDHLKAQLQATTTAKEIVQVLYSHLIEENVLAQFQIYLDKLQEKEEESIWHRYRIEGQVWDNIASILDAIVKIYEKQPITLEMFYSIFKMACKEAKLKSVPSTLDQVQLADINVSKIGNKKQVFFIGVTENTFPKKIQEDVFFGDLELEQLKEKDIVLKENSLSKYNMERYNIYEALNHIQEMLYISIPSSDFAGKSQRLSGLIGQMQKVGNFKVEGSVTRTEDTIELFSEETAFEEMVTKLYEWEEEKIPVDTILALYAYFKTSPRYQNLMQYKKRDSNLDQETIAMLYPDPFSSSISKLELFRKCPFSYFMQYVLNIKPRKEFDVTSLDIGNFMHHVVEQFSNYLLEHELSWQVILKLGKTLEEKYETVLQQIIEQELERHLGKQKESIKYAILKQKLQNTMKKVMIIIAQGFNQSEFEPYGYEIEFKDGKLFAPIEIQLDETHVMHLIGKIDRVDVLEQGDDLYVRVVDYKSSSKALSLEDIKEGLSLQLITYITSFIRNMEEKEYHQVIPAAMLYFNLSDHILNLKDYTKEDEKIENEIIKTLRMKGIFLKDITIIEKMDKKIEDTNKRMIDIAASTLKPGKQSNKALEKEEFQTLCHQAEQILQNIGQEILSGKVKIQPHPKAQHCKYCNYQTICRKGLAL